MHCKRLATGLLLLVFTSTGALAADGQRLTYLDNGCDPYYVHRDSPKLTTPRWVGEEGVEAVVILGIDDMRGHEKWEAFLRPILNRLKKIDGRAPVSIMTCQVDPNEPHLQTWLKEGVSLECHTIDHPCPLLRDGDFAKAKSTYDRCVDLMFSIPNNQPVAFRTPCCDSLNTNSPRMYAEIFNRTTPLSPRGSGAGGEGASQVGGRFLQIDTSVFNLFTANDPALPRELVFDADGREKFRKYVPKDRSFVNLIEDYPYPYVIDKLCWEFPCVTPSDWQAQHLHKPNNPITVRDWQAALDCTVIKQGVFCLVFHPHGWIRSEQLIDFIDYAVSKHGKKVKFLTFKEALERLNKNLLGGRPLRDEKGQASGALDVVIPARPELPSGVAARDAAGRDLGVRWLDLDDDGDLDVVCSNEDRYGIWLFDLKTRAWKEIVNKKREPGEAGIPPITVKGTNNGFFVRNRTLWWQNENTNLLKDLVDRRTFDELLRDVQPEPKTPEQSRKCIRPRPGFTVELAAAEPLVQDPIAFAWGPDGKLWVVEMGDYPLGVDGKGKHGGRVKYLEDRDGNWKYDKATVFLDNLGYPTGVLPWRKGVLVTCAPDILYAEDADGDGKADRREVLFTGFKEGNQQHRVNGLVWGLDGWVYGANGDSGGVIRSLKRERASPVNISGRDFRFKPDSGEFEAVTGQTQFGRCRDDWGDWFGGNNANPLWHFVLDDGYIRRNPHFAPPTPRVDVPVSPGQFPVFPISRLLPRFNDYHTANRFTSACSPTVYRDDLFGPHFAGNVFISEPVHNLVHRMVLTPQGTSFRGHRAPDEERSEFLASTDNWFRPTMIQTGPDGSLWIADMYRHVIEHPEWIPRDWQARLDLRAGHDMGRIYRVFPIDSKPRAMPRLDTLDTAELAAALDSPSGWQRDMAHMLLLWKADESAVPALKELVKNSPRPATRVQALYVLDGLNPHDGEPALQAIGDASASVRRHGARLARPRPGGASTMLPLLLKLADDPDPQVRMQVAYSMGNWEGRDVGETLGRLLARSDRDPYLHAAAMSSIRAENIGEVIVGFLRSGGTEVESLLRMASALGNQDALKRLLQEVSRSEDGRYRPWQYASLAGLLDRLDQQRGGLMKLGKADEEAYQAALANLQALFSSARKVALSAEESSEVRRAAVRLLGRGPSQQREDLDALAQLLTPQTPPELQRAAASALGALRRPESPALLLKPWKAYPPALRAQVLDTLLGRDDWTELLLAAVEAKQVLPFDIDAARRQRLLDHRSVDVRLRAAKVFEGSISSDRQKVIDGYRAALATKGDAEKGRVVFTKTCSACHKLGGVGADVGPDLGAMSDKSPEYLLMAILDPNRAVESRYLNYLALTKDGQTLSGLLSSETANSITLVGAEGKPITLLRTEIEQLQSTGKSAMPEGLEKDLKQADMADLLAFLTAAFPQRQRKTFAGNQPAVVQPAENGTLNLTAGNCAIFGRTLVFESESSNLGYWQSDDDVAEWTLAVPRDGRYAVTIEYACHDSSAGNTLAVIVGDQRLEFKVAGTGNWESYRQQQIGTLRLAAGEQRLVARPSGPIRNSLIDLRSLRLMLVQEAK